MNYLLDTHIAIWAIEDNRRLSGRARERILAPEARCHVSVASLWEIAIKHASPRGSVTMPMSADVALAFFKASGFVLIPVLPAHVLTLQQLPPMTTDPFDRMLVATAISEPFHFLTHDSQLGVYGSAVIEV